MEEQFVNIGVPVCSRAPQVTFGPFNRPSILMLSGKAEIIRQDSGLRCVRRPVVYRCERGTNRDTAAVTLATRSVHPTAALFLFLCDHCMACHSGCPSVSLIFIALRAAQGC